MIQVDFVFRSNVVKRVALPAVPALHTFVRFEGDDVLYQVEGTVWRLDQPAAVAVLYLGEMKPIERTQRRADT